MNREEVKTFLFPFALFKPGNNVGNNGVRPDPDGTDGAHRIFLKDFTKYRGVMICMISSARLIR